MSNRIKNLASIFETKKDSNQKGPIKDRKTLNKEKSKIISKDNSDMIIHEYPKLTPYDCKILVFMGNNQDKFINTFINTYSNITYKDKYRYKIEFNDSNDDLRIYNIESLLPDKKNIKIVSFPFYEKIEDIFNNQVMKKFVQKNLKKINYFFITLEDKKVFDKYELMFFLFFMNICFDEKLKEKIIILFSSDSSKNNPIIDNNNNESRNEIIKSIFKDTNSHFLSEEIFGVDFSSLFTPEYFFINNNIIFQKHNNSDEEEEWKAMNEEMKKIQKKILLSERKEYCFNNICLINELVFYDKKNITTNIDELKKVEKKEDFTFLLNYLIHCNMKIDISIILFHIYNKIYPNNKINKSEKEIHLKKDENLILNIYMFSKIKFSNLLLIDCQKCDLDNTYLYVIQNIFSSNLKILNLSNNKFTDMEVFNKEDVLINLEDLDLSFNNIENINPLINTKFPNLKKLNLNHNKISDISCLGADLHFNVLDDLNLSYNNIKCLNKINIPSLKFINLLDNEISSGIDEFLSLSYGISELTLKKEDNKIYFNYFNYDWTKSLNTASIKFKYFIENNEINNLLEKISFKGINKLNLEEFDNIEFLRNDSLNKLSELNIEKNHINDITIFNDVKFNNIRRVKYNENIDYINGFDSLNKFKNITIEKFDISKKNNKYKCVMKTDYSLYNPTFIFDEINFLKNNLFERAKTINLSQSIWDNNLSFFYDGIKNIGSFPMLKKLEPKKLKISYEDNKYKCSIDYYGISYLNIKMYFNSDDLNIFHYDYFNKIIEIDFYETKFDDNINLSGTKYPNLEKVILKYNKIETVKIFSIMDEIRNNGKYINFDSYANECNNRLLESLDDKMWMREIKNSGEDYVRIDYWKPFYFYIIINKSRMNNIKSFNYCDKIVLKNINLNDNEANFLTHSTLTNLKRLELDGNKITNIDFLGKIPSGYLDYVSIKSNLIEDGIEYINNNIKSEKVRDINVKKKDNDGLIISVYYIGNYHLYFDNFYNINKNMEILKRINLENIASLDLSNLNLKNIDFLLNDTLSNLSKLNLDKNQIEDISIFKKDNAHLSKINNLSILENPIKDGIYVFKDNFFMKCIYIELTIYKTSDKYKIYAEFKKPNFKIEFYINSIYDIKNIFDFQNCVISLNTNGVEGLEDIKNDQYVKESSEKCTMLKSFLKTFNNSTINIINDYPSSENNKENNILINNDNYNIIEKTIKYISNRKNTFYISNLCLHKLKPENEEFLKSIKFLYYETLSLFDCQINLSILKDLHIPNLRKIDLSNTVVSNFSGLCECDNLRNLEVLYISNNENVDFSLLKNAKFEFLKELYLSNDNISDLENIKIKDYPFKELSVLDLSNNRIAKLKQFSSLESIFPKLKVLNLENNIIDDEYELSYINTAHMKIKLSGNKVGRKFMIMH